MISLCISNFSLSRCQKWEKVTTLPRIDHTHSQKGPIAIQLFSFAHQTREDGMVSVRGNQKIERGKGLYIQYKIIIQMPRGPQRGLAGWGLILLLTTPLIIERAPSLAIQLFFFAHQTREDGRNLILLQQQLQSIKKFSLQNNIQFVCA